MSTLTSPTPLNQERDRTKIPDKYKWNLLDLYADEAAWRRDKDTIAAEIPKMGRFKGTLMSSPATLADALDEMFDLDRRVSILWVYASLLADEDVREGRPQAMRQEMIQLYTGFQSVTAYVSPEILVADKERVEEFISAEPRLDQFAFYLRETIRRAAHTLTENEERILADSQPLSGGAHSIYNILTNADLPYPTVTLSDGRSVKVDQAAYSDLRALPNRKDRETVMSAFFESLGAFGRTFGATMNTEAQKMLFFAKSRKYGSALEMSLDGPNIPVSVYTRLVDGVNRHLPTFHRYLKLRQRMLELDQLHYYDLYAPLVASVKAEFSPDEAQHHVLAAVAPLGADYVGVMRRAFDERWIDLFPNDGKRSGAYSSGGAYGVHPYILMNFNGKYTDVSTLAHELGHTMHSFLSNTTQPYSLAQYQTFVAEVASTFNESLLMDHMLRNTEDKATRVSLLGNYLETIKGTVFRSTQFAEFEMLLHQKAQAGEPIVGDSLAALYMDVTKKYYGHDAGVCVVDDYIAHEWSFIPHFYLEFYTFQYATSFCAAEALASRVKSGDADATKRFLKFLSSGGSKYPIDLLREAGVDMTTDVPLDETVRAMNRAMDEMESLL